MPVPSTTHLLFIPTYNTGPKVLETVREALAAWQPVWVVTDGSDDGTTAQLEALAHADFKRMKTLWDLRMEYVRGHDQSVQSILNALDNKIAGSSAPRPPRPPAPSTPGATSGGADSWISLERAKLQEELSQQTIAVKVWKRLGMK